jgi:hypothetical protein
VFSGLQPACSRLAASASAAPTWMVVMAFGLVFIVVQVEVPFQRERE